jgi:hypothetical protein
MNRIVNRGIFYGDLYMGTKFLLENLHGRDTWKMQE